VSRPSQISDSDSVVDWFPGWSGSQSLGAIGQSGGSSAAKIDPQSSAPLASVSTTTGGPPGSLASSRHWPEQSKSTWRHSMCGGTAFSMRKSRTFWPGKTDSGLIKTSSPPGE
jgi:hypothetical protein